MSLTPPTLVHTSAVGRLFELATFILNAQLNELQNPESQAVIQNYNLDQDSKVGSFVVAFNFDSSTDPTTGNLINIVEDPYIDPA